MFSRSKIKADARVDLNNFKYMKYYIIVFIITIVSGISRTQTFNGFDADGFREISYTTGIPGMTLLLTIISSITVGYLFYLKVNKKSLTDVSIGDPYNGLTFSPILKLFLAGLLIGLITVLPFLIIMFGIIFAAFSGSDILMLFLIMIGLLSFIAVYVILYRYRAVSYLIMLDFYESKDRDIIQYFKESSRIMNGHKMESFILDLSLIGWIILSIIPFVFLWTIPYMNQVYINYFAFLIEDDPEYNKDQTDLYQPKSDNFGQYVDVNGDVFEEINSDSEFKEVITAEDFVKSDQSKDIGSDYKNSITDFKSESLMDTDTNNDNETNLDDEN